MEKSDGVCGHLRSFTEIDVVASINRLCFEAHRLHVAKGFHDEPKTVPHLLGLAMSELGEAMNADRIVVDKTATNPTGTLMSEKIPGFTMVEEEVADCILRLFDFAGLHRLRLGEAVLAKHDYNRTRPPKHGKRY